MCVLLITWLLLGVGKLAIKPVNSTSCVAVVTLTAHPKSILNRFVIERFGGVFCAFTLPFDFFVDIRVLVIELSQIYSFFLSL